MARAAGESPFSEKLLTVAGRFLNYDAIPTHIKIATANHPRT